jgi:protocatechuate 3,4-dioxygenase beta subunit
VKRFQLAFATVVFALVAIGILVESSRDWRPLPGALGIERSAELAPVSVPLGTERLAGRVLAADGRPAGEVLVTLSRGEAATPASPGSAEPLHWASTDREGRFELEGLDPGRYRAMLLTLGTPPASFPLDVPAPREVLWVLPEPRPDPESLPEIRRARLEGRILAPLAEEGASLAGYEVWLAPAAGVPALAGAVERRARTDERGRFRFDGVVAVDHVARALPPWAAGGSWPVVGSARAEPGAGLVRIGIDAGEIAGLIDDAVGRPIEGALVQLAPADAPERPWPPAVTDEAGAFRIADLPPGSYRLSVRAGSADAVRAVEVRAGERTELAIAGLAPAPDR